MKLIFCDCSLSNIIIPIAKQYPEWMPTTRQVLLPQLFFVYRDSYFTEYHSFSLLEAFLLFKCSSQNMAVIMRCILLHESWLSQTKYITSSASCFKAPQHHLTMQFSIITMSRYWILLNFFSTENLGSFYMNCCWISSHTIQCL